MKVFVTGAAGRLGASIVEAFGDCQVVAPARASLDVADAAAVMRAVSEARPDVIVNCVAYNHVDQAEEYPAEAFAINAFAVRILARAAEDAGAAFVHYGSDFVFDGEATEPYPEEARTSPRSAYGLSKLLGEWFALEAPRGFVLRVESLFGAARGWTGRAGSLDMIVGALEAGRVARVFTDRVVSPSYVEDVAAATRHLIDVDATPGLYHCVNAGQATWYEVAEEAARLLGVAPRLEPITTAASALKASRPRFCALATGKLAAAGFPMPTWRDALGRWLASRERVGRHDTIDGVDG
ncbi:MAG: NAD(P)-dependent oxidoreductase [Acidobacteria bacterium]|nr:NAD(P)-dependent oxidoreductase [Acidobacteriota bacterium]